MEVNYWKVGIVTTLIMCAIFSPRMLLVYLLIFLVFVMIGHFFHDMVDYEKYTYDENFVINGWKVIGHWFLCKPKDLGL